MKRLEYERRFRTLRTHSRNAADPVMLLAQVARERHRLGQEQRSLVKRIKRIEARLTAIAATETKLFPMLRSDSPPDRDTGPAPRPALAFGPAITLQY